MINANNAIKNYLTTKAPKVFHKGTQSENYKTTLLIPSFKCLTLKFTSNPNLQLDNFR